MTRPRNPLKFGRIVKLWLKKEGLTQRRFADAIGWRESRVSKFLSDDGGGHLPEELTAEVAKLVRVDVDEVRWLAGRARVSQRDPWAFTRYERELERLQEIAVNDAEEPAQHDVGSGKHEQQRDGDVSFER